MTGPVRSDSTIPALDAFVSGLSPGGKSSRAARKLYALLSALDPSRDLAAQAQVLERLGRYVCDGPKPQENAGESAATTRLRLLVRALETVPVFASRLSAIVASVVSAGEALRLLCEIGLPNDRGLWYETMDRLSRRFLPVPPDHGDLAELVARLFRRERDAAWLSTLPAALMADLERLLGDPWRPLGNAAEDALALLTTRVSALGLSEDIRRRGPGGSVRDSPFFQLPRAARHELHPLIAACRRDLLVVYENLDQFGVSIDVVYRLDVIAKSLDRIEALLTVLEPRSAPELLSAETALVAKLVRARIREASVRDVVRSNLRLLSQKVIERAGETGEHYITTTRGEWWKMLASAAGGGFLTVFTVVAKFLTKTTHLAPALDGLVNAANYATSFVTMQVLGFTLATKQPSMTAAALAGSIRERPDAHQLDDLVTTIARICRSQLAAALGNVGVVIPSAIVFDVLFRVWQGRAFLNEETARYTVSSFHPLESGTLAYAALTGVLLWLSSLAAGWLENWAVYRRLPEAIAEHRAQRFLGKRLLGFFSRFFKKHVAGFGGSVALGFLLGMVPAFGQFFGVALEVRHVTLSAGSLALSFHALGAQALLSAPGLWAMAGIVAIGALNFGVSFVFALGVAFRAREVPFSRGLRLFAAVLRRLLRSPLEFVFPPSWERPLDPQSFRPSHAELAGRADG